MSKTHELVCTDLDVFGLQQQVKDNYNEFDKLIIADLQITLHTQK